MSDVIYLTQAVDEKHLKSIFENGAKNMLDNCATPYVHPVGAVVEATKSMLNDIWESSYE